MVSEVASLLNEQGLINLDNTGKKWYNDGNNNFFCLSEEDRKNKWGRGSFQNAVNQRGWHGVLLKNKKTGEVLSVYGIKREIAKHLGVGETILDRILGMIGGSSG